MKPLQQRICQHVFVRKEALERTDLRSGTRGNFRHRGSIEAFFRDDRRRRLQQCRDTLLPRPALRS